MLHDHTNERKIGYVLKRYPRYSETFIVNEILAHEASGLAIEIFALRPPCDTHFQNAISRVRAPVTYIPSAGVKTVDLWDEIQAAAVDLPDLWGNLASAAGEDAFTVFQSVVLARLVKQNGVTQLHAHFATSVASVARLAAAFVGIPFTFTAHAKDIFHESVVPDDLKRKLDSASGVVTVSQYNREFLSRSFGSIADRVETIYNGIDLHTFNYSSPERRDPKIVAVGRLVEKKGFDDLIDACAILADQGERFECLIIGAGELDLHLREKVDRTRLANIVRFLGPQPQTEVIRIVQSSAVLAAPCVVGLDGNRDGLPTVLLEAMALGTPCVATDVTGIPEVVQHNNTGLITAQHDPLALARAIKELISRDHFRVRIAENARRLIESSFDIEKNAALLRDLFERVAVSDQVVKRRAA